MKLEDIHSVYFLGIGGIGMSALARWFKHNGKAVSGYDKTNEIDINELKKSKFITNSYHQQRSDRIFNLCKKILTTKRINHVVL